MNPPIRRVAIAALVMFLALLINANYVQVIDAGSLRNNPHNGLVLVRQYSRQRGPIVVGGKAVAQSVATHDALKYLRIYPGGAEYAPATGYYSVIYGASGIEQFENSILAGSDSRLVVRSISNLISGQSSSGGVVVLTINPAAQAAAWNALQGKRGAVVALNPQTGAILALVTTPSYDPTLISTHDGRTDQTNFRRLLADPNTPLLDRAISQTYPPGSMFKIVTAAAALSSGRYTVNSVVPSPRQLPLPLTNIALHNFGNESCGNGNSDTILDAFRISCNTAFAGIGMSVGAAALHRQADAFGFDSGYSVPLPVTSSVFPAHPDQPETGLSAIGQFDVRITPLQAAMLSAAVANNGVMMKPYLVKQLEAPDLSILAQTQPSQLGRAVSPQVADQLKTMMELVVAAGTGTAAQIPGVTVAGKTGTAQHGTGLPPDAWFTAFAPADNPQVAVAVIVEDGGNLGSDATGGAVAAPIAKAVIQAVLGK